MRIMEADLACDGGRMPYTFPGRNRVHLFVSSMLFKRLIGMQARRNRGLLAIGCENAALSYCALGTLATRTS